MDWTDKLFVIISMVVAAAILAPWALQSGVH